MNRTGCPSAAQLAAFLDGRLPQAERTRLLTHLDACQDCFEWFCEAQRERASGTDEDADLSLTDPPVQAHPSVRISRWIWVGALAASLVVGFFVFRGQPEPGESRLAEMIAPLASRATPLSPYLNRSIFPGFSPSRPSRSDFQLGIAVVDLYAIALENRPTEVVRVRDQALALLRDRESVGQYAKIARAMEESVSPSRVLDWDRELERTASQSYPLGKWAETLLLAATSRRPDYLRSETTEELMGGIEARFPAPVRTALHDLKLARDPTEESDRLFALRLALLQWIESQGSGRR